MIHVHLSFRTGPNLTSETTISMEGDRNGHDRWSQPLTLYEAEKLKRDLDWVIAEYNRVRPVDDDEEDGQTEIDDE